jgi:hypothetical protein
VYQGGDLQGVRGLEIVTNMLERVCEMSQTEQTPKPSPGPAGELSQDDNLDTRDGHIGKQEGRDSSQDAIRDRCEESSNLQQSNKTHYQLYSQYFEG